MININYIVLLKCWGIEIKENDIHTVDTKVMKYIIYRTLIDNFQLQI